MTKCYDIDHAAEHAASCFDQMLSALRLAAERIEMNNYGGEEDESLAEVKAAIAAAEGREGDTPHATDAAPETEFLCVGYYDDGSRFAENVTAANAEDAEALAEAQWPAVNWAGFIALRDGVMTVEG